jgi:predicted site-specific integrase-resolvase
MSNTALKKLELIQKIAKLPPQNLGEVDKFVQKILSQLQTENKMPTSLKGIWKNKGFEKIIDLESEIKSVRKELENSILEKDI